MRVTHLIAAAVFLTFLVLCWETFQLSEHERVVLPAVNRAVGFASQLALMETQAPTLAPTVSPTPTPEMFLFATLGTSTAYVELRVMLQSLHEFHPTAPVYIACTSKLAKLLRTDYLDEYPEHRLHLRESVDPALEGTKRKDMEAKGTWITLMLAKAEVLAMALGNRTRAQVEHGVGVWFLDGDVTLLQPIPLQHTPPPDADLGLSYHNIVERGERSYGRYNGGYLFVRNETFGDWWVEETQRNQDKYYFEQGTLDVASSLGGYRVWELPNTHNYGWWRRDYARKPETKESRSLLFNTTDAGLTYDGELVVSVHTHWRSGNSYNRFVLDRLPRQHPLRVKWVQELYNYDKRIRQKKARKAREAEAKRREAMQDKDDAVDATKETRDGD